MALLSSILFIFQKPGETLEILENEEFATVFLLKKLRLGTLERQ